MPLTTCADCSQPVSSEAISCPTCGRPMKERSYLTPLGQVVVGGLVLVACLGWPPMFIIVLLVFFGRFVRRLARRSTGGAVLGAALLVALSIGLMYLLHNSGLVVMVLAPLLCGCIWLVIAARMRATSEA